MRALVLESHASAESRPLALRDVPNPQPSRGEVRLRVTACGACRTDLHLVEGELPDRPLPRIPGHQVVGRVDALGEGVTTVAPGDRVGVAWLQSTCRTCEFCREGRENLCASPRFTGWDVDGGFAERCLAPADWLYPLPDAFSDVAAAPLLCAGIIGFRALRRSGVRPGERLAIYGFGSSAHVTIQVARHWGCEVFVASLREEHRRLARDLGATWVGEADAMPPRSVHGAILFAPAGELVPPALRALRRGGTLACAGIHVSRIPELDYAAELFHERTLTSVTANTRDDGLDLLRVAAEIPIQTRCTEFPLERGNNALIALKQGRIRGAAVLTFE